MVLKVLDEEFSVCKLETLPEIDPGQPFVFTEILMYRMKNSRKQTAVKICVIEMKEA